MWPFGSEIYDWVFDDLSDPSSGTFGDKEISELLLSQCQITSQTVAISPTNRARTRIGVGEEVTLTVNPGPATWSITSGSGSLNPSRGSHTDVTYTAGDTAGSVTITATGASCSCTITFSIIEPSWTMVRISGTNLKHTLGHPDCGWLGTIYIHPNDVNFTRIEIREMDSLSVASGSYYPSHHNRYHGNYPLPKRVSDWFTVNFHSPSDGSIAFMQDNVYSGYPDASVTGTQPPFNIGDYYWPITWQWRVSGSTNIHNFPSVRQEHEIFANGKCESRKGGHTEHTMWNDPTSTY